MLLDRYISYSFLKSLTFSLFTLTFIFIISESFTLFASSSTQAIHYIYLFILYSLPDTIYLALPIALMFSSCYTISQFKTQSELIAVYAAGRSLERAILIPLLLSFFLGFSKIMMSTSFLPAIKEKANHYKSIFMKGSYRSLKKEIRAKNFRGEEGFYYINYYNRKTKQCTDGFSYLLLDKNNTPLRFYEADKATFDLKKEIWILKKARIFFFDSDIKITQIDNKETWPLSVPERPSFFEKIVQEPSSLSLQSLYKEIQNLQKSGIDAKKHIIEFHTQLSLPLTCLFLCFLGTISAKYGKRRGGNSFVQSLIFCSIAIFIYYLGFTFSNSMAKAGIFHPALAPWIPIGIYSLVFVYMAKR